MTPFAAKVPAAAFHLPAPNLMLKRAVRQVLNRVGYEVVRANKHPSLGSFLEGALIGMSSVLDRPLRIVQIGANDGVTSDPLASFLETMGRHVHALRIEPHPAVFELLKELHLGQAGVTLLNVAIDESPGTMDLFFLREDDWDRYRSVSGYNPTGITSTSRQHVAEHVARALKLSSIEADALIDSVSVRCMPLSDALRESDFGTPVDVLQVDAEGLDDRIILSSNVDDLGFALINYEVKHLTDERHHILGEHLDGLGYRRLRFDRDECAFRVH